MALGSCLARSNISLAVVAEAVSSCAVSRTFSSLLATGPPLRRISCSFVLGRGSRSYEPSAPARLLAARTSDSGVVRLSMFLR